MPARRNPSALEATAGFYRKHRDRFPPTGNSAEVKVFRNNCVTWKSPFARPKNIPPLTCDPKRHLSGDYNENASCATPLSYLKRRLQTREQMCCLLESVERRIAVCARACRLVLSLTFEGNSLEESSFFPIERQRTWDEIIAAQT